MNPLSNCESLSSVPAPLSAAVTTLPFATSTILPPILSEEFGEILNVCPGFPIQIKVYSTPDTVAGNVNRQKIISTLADGTTLTIGQSGATILQSTNAATITLL